MNYKSNELLRKQARANSDWLQAEMARLDHVAALSKAMISGNQDILAKGSGPDIEAARRDVADLRKQFAPECEKFGEGFISNLTLGHRFAQIMREYKRRSDANDEEAARSRRFNDALSAVPLSSIFSQRVN